LSLLVSARRVLVGERRECAGPRGQPDERKGPRDPTPHAATVRETRWRDKRKSGDDIVQDWSIMDPTAAVPETVTLPLGLEDGAAPKNDETRITFAESMRLRE
jgi:hypothetical protein